MPSRFYDPNNTEEQRLRRAAWGDEGANRSFTDRTGQIATDRTEADRLARAMVDNPGWDRLATPEQRGLAGVGAIGGAGMLGRAQESGFVVNPNDLLHERSFGTAATIGARARGFGGPPTAVEMFGTDAQKAAAQGIYDRAREQFLMDQAGLNGLARSAAGGSEGRAAAMRELEALRMQRAQEDARQSADLARREGFANEQTVAGITAAGRQAAAAAAAAGQVDAAREQAKGREAAAGKRAEGVVEAQRIQSESNKEIAAETRRLQREQDELRKQELGRPIALGGGAAAVQQKDGTWKIDVGKTDADGKPQGVTLKPGESFYNPQTGETFVAPGADRTSIEAEISTILELMSRTIDEKRRAPLQKQLDAARDRLAKLPGGAVAPSSAAPAPAAGGWAPVWTPPR